MAVARPLLGFPFAAWPQRGLKVAARVTTAGEVPAGMGWGGLKGSLWVPSPPTLTPGHSRGVRGRR